jgi:trehalose-phosphatase
LLLDFDGTLVPLASDPDQVRLDPVVRQVLRRLANHPRATVYIISGRRLASLRRVATVPGLHLLGLHGWERRGVSFPRGERRLLREAKRWLAPRLPRSPGIKLEDKGLSLAVHHRGATRLAVQRARRVTRQARDRFRPGLHLLAGKKMWELLPAAVDGKGPATKWLLGKLPRRALPIFIGDDVSDETAFAVLPHGLTLHVGGKASTKARYWLRNPGEVREFLGRLEAMINCKRPSVRSNS